VRICSLLPSATEIVFALGMGDSLVGVTHECDFPAAALRLPKVTRSHIPPGISSAEIDAAVSSALGTAGTLYELDRARLEELRPDLILTQRLCDVCAVSFDRVEEAVASLPGQPAVMNLEPRGLDDILENIRAVGQAVGAEPSADDVVRGLRRRIEAVRQATAKLGTRPRVVCLEWVDPPYCGGHWMKELVEIAGGRDDLAVLDRPSHRIDWNRVLEFRPEVLVLTCCGFGLERALEEGDILARFEGVLELPAAESGRIFATDGSSYFSRPGPRIVDSLEILAHLIHPEAWPAPPLTGAFAPLSLTRLTTSDAVTPVRHS
jgi:iron complex transport system substrate-binding protein